MSDLPKPGKAPCKSCPYRQDAPRGLWERHEYAKLVEYDEPTPYQPIALFMCHSEPEALCAGWVGCHGKAKRGYELLALRFAERVDPSTFAYESPVPLFASGREAAKHGLSRLRNPDDRARRMIPRLERKIAKRKP